MAAFTGRESEVEQLLAAAGPTRSVTIHTVDGMPGVGKTALVTHAAHLLADRFANGQRFVRLHAHTPGQYPADPADVLAALLISVGVDPRHIPDSLDSRSDLWRDYLAGQRMLLVFDDAADHTQIEPLLPGTAGCLVLITSRRRLVALDGAEPLSLETSSPQDALLLFTRLARRNPAGDAEAHVAAETVRLCGYLPLAIALLAGRLAHHPQWDLTRFAADFARAQDRLGELTAGDRAVAAAFEMSYRDLPPERRRLFRRVGLHPGSDSDAFATAALDNIPLAQAHRELEALYTDHLIDSPAPGRYRMHDLIRTYARTLAQHDSCDDHVQATRRLLDYYQHTAETADRYLRRFARLSTAPLATPHAAAPELATRGQALTWMRVECPNLLACIDYATAHAQHRRVVHLTAVMAAFLRREGPWHKAAALHQTAATAARRSGDRLGEAHALHDLGHVQHLTGDYPAATDFLERALALYRDLDDPIGEAHALHDFGHVQHLTGNIPAAADLHQRALALYRDLHDRLGEADTLWDLGWVRSLAGDYPAAADFLEQALALYCDLGDRLGEAHALHDLGHVRSLTGDIPAAADLHQRALALYRDLDDRLGEADALWGLGHVESLTGDYPAAADLLDEALTVYRGLRGRLGEAHTLRELGRVRTLAGDYPAAADLLDQALALFRELGDHQGEAEVFNNTGTLLAVSTGPRMGLTWYRQALRLARQVYSPLEEARALEGAARCQARTGVRDAALVDLRMAVDIYRRLGATETKSAAAYLAVLETEGPSDDITVQESTDS